MNQDVREWYTNAFFRDDLGQEINSNVTFEDLFVALDNYKDVYDVLGVHDSLIRERVFVKLSEVMGVDYDYIYNQWLKG